MDTNSVEWAIKYPNYRFDSEEGNTYFGRTHSLTQEEVR